MEEYAFLETNKENNKIMQIIVNKYEQDYHMQIEDISKKTNKQILIKLVKELKNNYKIPYCDIAKNLNISLSTISRLMNK